jgi:hypothetical protein
MYCANANQATVNYKVNGTNKIYIAKAPLLPIDVIVDNSEAINQNFTQSFNGNVLTTYSFSVTAPLAISRDANAPQIYLVSGSWDG